ncbi:hypothetical protein ACFL03_11675 [Thermodesulfobacteriota bacterium]
MAKEQYLSLQHSESVVAQMAATIFAAYLKTNDINDDNENQYIRKAVQTAIKMAVFTDKAVKSDEEWMKKDEDLTPVDL